MAQTFAEALIDAQGRSEFVIVVVADIRGFSAFSTTNESPNIAMFIKRFYLQLINKYFKGANFVKPTGDGLLMTFPYSEQSLLKVSERVIGSCIACLNDFPTICDNDPMINFKVPQAIGFGIARGTACCLYSGEQILDYSGHLLNLAARLNDLARPSGIVIDGDYLTSVIPESQRKMFEMQEVYLRSLAEETPKAVMSLAEYVQIPEHALTPLAGENWITIVKTFTRSKLAKIAPFWRQRLPSRAKAANKVRIRLRMPRKGLKGIYANTEFENFTYVEEGSSPFLKLDMDKIRTLVAQGDFSRSAKLAIHIEYVPRTPA
jgi:class 3 adenylate cyclase